MQNRQAVLTEAAQLHSFVETTTRLCSDLRDDYPVFAEASLRFFQYVQALGKSTQGYLQAFPATYLKSTDPRAARSKLQKLFSLKTGWEALHAYIKPTLDADSLHLPSSLITALGDRVNSVSDWGDYRFVLFHTNEANYLQIPSGMAREVANDIADIVGFDRFDPNLGLVGVPYSQADSIFLNCVLPHEFAHFIYQEYSDDDVEDQIDSSIDAHLTLNSDDLAWCSDEIKSWVEETFCDLMAICMIGPAFSLSLVRLISANAIVGRSDGEPSDAYAFKDGYPADVARLHYHRKLLEGLGWWPLVKEWRCATIKALEKSTNWSEYITIEGSLPEGVKQDKLFEVYREVCDWLVTYCAKFFTDTAEQVAAYQLQAPEISQYLSRAIVPSTVLIAGEEVYPNPVTLLNAGLHFLLEELPELIQNIAGEDPESVETQSRIGARVELWILKAIEDNRLLARQETT